MQLLDLHGKWTLRSKSGQHVVPAQVPGDNVERVARGTPDSRSIPSRQRSRPPWIGREDWIYEREFRVSPAFLREIDLPELRRSRHHCHASFINGRRVAHSENMFARVRVEVKKFLRAGPNTIRIEFASPEKAAALEARAVALPDSARHQPGAVDAPESDPQGAMSFRLGLGHLPDGVRHQRRAFISARLRSAASSTSPPPSSTGRGRRDSGQSRPR